jgi:hypothetical protein
MPLRASSVRLDIDGNLFPDLAPIYRHWIEIRGRRPAPLRADFDPLDVPTQLLPRVMMVDVFRDPLDFEYRLCGTALRARHGGELTGLSVRDLRPRCYADLIWQQYIEIIETGTPALYVNQVPCTGNALYRHGVLRLPFSPLDGTVDLVVSVDYYGSEKAELAEFFETAEDALLADQLV